MKTKNIMEREADIPLKRLDRIYRIRSNTKQKSLNLWVWRISEPWEQDSWFGDISMREGNQSLCWFSRATTDWGAQTTWILEAVGLRTGWFLLWPHSLFYAWLPFSSVFTWISPSMCLYPNVFVREHRSYWIKEHPHDLILP